MLIAYGDHDTGSRANHRRHGVFRLHSASDRHHPGRNTRVNLPASITTIADTAFGDCPNLTLYGYISSAAYPYAKTNHLAFRGFMDEPDFVLPSGLTTIEDYAFYGIPAEVVYIPDGVTKMGELAFSYCPNLRQIWIPASLTTTDSIITSLYGSPVVVIGNSDAARDFAKKAGKEYVEAAE